MTFLIETVVGFIRVLVRPLVPHPRHVVPAGGGGVDLGFPSRVSSTRLALIA